MFFHWKEFAFYYFIKSANNTFIQVVLVFDCYDHVGCLSKENDKGQREVNLWRAACKPFKAEELSRVQFWLMHFCFNFRERSFGSPLVEQASAWVVP